MKSLASNSSSSSSSSLGRNGGGGGTSAQLSHTEVAAVRQLIAGYRESAAFLLRSADELENLILQQNWTSHSLSSTPFLSLFKLISLDYRLRPAHGAFITIIIIVRCFWSHLARVRERTTQLHQAFTFISACWSFSSGERRWTAEVRMSYRGDGRGAPKDTAVLL